MSDPRARVVEALLRAYREGYFPMADPEGVHGRAGAMLWLSPDPRGVIPLEDGGLHVPRSLRRTLNKAPFRVTTDESFGDVIRGCAAPRWYESGTWIDDRILGAYTALFEAGHAHSIEAWVEDEAQEQPDRDRPRTLVGGLYGVHIGAAFFAESMFCSPELGGTDASKVCLVTLWNHLRARGFMLLDVQFTNEHIERFGVVEIPRRDYLRRLSLAVGAPVSWGPLAGDPRSA